MIKLRKSGDLQPGVNLTAMIDVLLVLILFFMVSSTLSRPGAIPLELPSTQGKTEKPDEAVSVNVRQDGAVFLEDTPSTLEEIEVNLRKRGVSPRQGKVRLRGDERIPYARLVEVMDALRKAGFEKISLETVAK